jgi:flagellar basal body-associated protein FliL
MQILIAVVLVIAVGIGAYWFGVRNAKVVESTAFTFSTKLEKATKLGVANTDITDIVEVCPTGRWFIFRGSGRALLVGANRYHYSLNWDPEKDIKAQAVQGDSGVHDLRVDVRNIEITMDTVPKIRVYTIDDSILVDMNRETAQFKDEMLRRLQIIARNKLNTEEGKTELSDAIKNHIYRIYAGERSRVRNIEVAYGQDTFGAPQSYMFEEECTKPVMTDLIAAQPKGTGRIRGRTARNSIDKLEEKDGITVYRWASKK